MLCSRFLVVNFTERKNTVLHGSPTLHALRNDKTIGWLVDQAIDIKVREM